jgi:hypothetical protein
MMETDNCRRHAAECQRLAEITDDPKIQKELLALAQAWLQMEVSDSSVGISDGAEHSANKPAETA